MSQELIKRLSHPEPEMRSLAIRDLVLSDRKDRISVLVAALLRIHLKSEYQG